MLFNCPLDMCKPVDPYLFPARGRKLDLVVGVFPALDSLIPTFSPQGDGNFVATSSTLDSAASRVDPYLFPARGRKPRSI